MLSPVYNYQVLLPILSLLNYFPSECLLAWVDWLLDVRLGAV